MEAFKLIVSYGFAFTIAKTLDEVEISRATLKSTQVDASHHALDKKKEKGREEMKAILL